MARFINPDPQFLDSKGNPLNGGFLAFFLSTTSTPTPTYTDATLGTPNPLVITLGSDGRIGNCFLDPAVTYKAVLSDSLTNVLWTMDPINNLLSTTFASVQVYPGNPNGHVAGNAGTVGVRGADVVWDTVDQLLYVCTSTGTTTTAVWTAVANSLTGGEDIYTSTQTIGLANVGRIATANSAAAMTFNLTAAATIGTNKIFGFKNIGAGVLTIDPNGAELIDGLATTTLSTNEGLMVYCTGTGWRVMSDHITLEAPEVTVADSATPAIGAASSVNVLAAGTTTITGFDTVGAGVRRVVRFASARTLTYNVTSLILLGGISRSVTANDISIFRSEGSGNWRELSTERANTYPLISQPGFRNILRRNGGLEVWQRGAGGAAVIAVPAGPAVTYTADGWYLQTSANQASTVTQVAGLTNGSQWAAKVQRNNGQTGTAQMIFGFPLDTDELYPLLGQFVTLSVTIKAGANWSPASGNLSVYLQVGTGTPVKIAAGFTGATNAISVTQAITASAVRYQFTSAAIVPITTRQAEVAFIWTPVGTAGADDSLSIDNVQLEIVPDVSQQASPFEYMNFQEQLALCRRHYQKSFVYGTAPAQNAGTGIGELQFLSSVIAGAATLHGVRFSPTTMRIAPAVVTFNPSAANAEIRNNTLGTDCTITAATSININGFTVTGAVPGSTVNANLMLSHFTADAGI